MSTRKAVEKQGIALVEGIPNYSAQVEDDGKIASLATNDDADPAPTTEVAALVGAGVVDPAPVTETNLTDVLVKTVASVLKGKLFTKAKTLFIGATIYYQGTTFKVVAMDQHTDATGKDFREWQFHLIEPVSGPVHGVAALDKPHKWDGKKIAKAEVMHMPA